MKPVKIYDKFEFHKMLTMYPELDSLLKKHPEGCVFSVKRRGSYRIQPVSATENPRGIYVNDQGVWQIEPVDIT